MIIEETICMIDLLMDLPIGMSEFLEIGNKREL
jgi:hypothetical protein